MIARRKKPDGLPFRLYVYQGIRKTSYWYKHRDNTRETLAEARTVDKAAVIKARKDAIEKANHINEGVSIKGSVTELIEKYFDWQENLPSSSELRKAQTTLDGNHQEAKNIVKFFGNMDPSAVKPKHCYAYQDARIQSGAGPTANKELALLSAVYEFARRRGLLEINPCRGIKRVPTKPKTFLLNEDDLEFAVEISRKLGGSFFIQGLAAKVCYLTLKRPAEILSLTRKQISADGIIFTAAKRKAGQADIQGLITWSPELRAAIEEALSIKRQDGASLINVFGNQAGQRYSRSGWGTLWNRFMAHCIKAAEAQGRSFARFTLADCRPAGVTDKRAAGATDTQDATLHSDARMIERHYDRRRVRVAKPVR